MYATAPKLAGLAAGIVLCALPVTAWAAPKTKRPPPEISIENGRKVALNSFEVVFIESTPKPGTRAKPPRKPVLKLEEPLAPGEKKMLKLTGARGCDYIARWTFADAGDEGQVNLCGDPKIVLTD